MEKNKDIKNCPFCGSVAEIKKESARDYGAYLYYVQCTGVKKHRLYPHKYTEKEAIEVWNERSE
jgi:hypothetical protein